MSNKDFTADFSEGEHDFPGIHDAGIEPAKKNYESLNKWAKSFIAQMKEAGVNIPDLYQLLPPEAYEPTGQGEEEIDEKEIKNRIEGILSKMIKYVPQIQSVVSFGCIEEIYKLILHEHQQTALLSRQLLRSEQKLKEAGERIKELELSNRSISGDFFKVLEENYQAQIAGFYNDDKTAEEKKIRNAVIKEYSDLIQIYKSGKWLNPCPH